jgi:hypothetical protein
MVTRLIGALCNLQRYSMAERPAAAMIFRLPRPHAPRRCWPDLSSTVPFAALLDTSVNAKFPRSDIGYP